MTKKVDTWMPLLVDKYLGDTTHLTTEQHGAYLLLLMTMWKRDGSLSNSDAQLCAVTRLSPPKWKAMKPVLMEFFETDGESLTQKRLTAELDRAKRTNGAKSVAGLKGAAKRWQSDGSANGNEHGSANGIDMANGEQTGWQTGAPTHTPSSLRSETLTEESDPHGISPTDGGRVCLLMKRQGISDIAPGHPDLLALISAGASDEEFESAARTAVTKEKGFTYALGVLKRQRIDAAKTATQMHNGKLPATETAFARNRREMVEQMTGGRVSAKPPGHSQTAMENVNAPDPLALG